MDGMTDREKAIEWARNLPADALVMDLESTGLRPPVEIVQLAVINLRGETLIDTLVRPNIPIPEAAAAIHGITDDMVATAPDFREVFEQLREVVSFRPVLVYNCSYDTGVLLDCCWRRSMQHLDTHDWQCVMLQYAAYLGEPSRRPGEYRWPRLPPMPGAEADAHSALADCLSTLHVLRTMAGGEVGTVTAGLLT